MDISLFEVREQLALIYFDVSLIFFSTPQEHIAHEKVFSTHVEETEVTLKLNKCAFCTNQMKYVSLVMKPGRLEVANHTADTVCDLSVPIAAT